MYCHKATLFQCFKNHLKKNNTLELKRLSTSLTSVHAIPYIKTKAPIVNHSLQAANLRKKNNERPGLLGIKRNMITWYMDDGKQVGATIIEIDSCEVIGHKTLAKDGYSSVLVGHIDKLKKVNKKSLKICFEAKVSPKKNYKEFRVLDDSCLIPIGSELRADYFAVGQPIDVIGVTKGQGFCGVMKRHGFKGLRATHGVSKAHRSAGATGGNQDPGRVFPGKKMAGKHGGKNCTLKSCIVLYVDGDAGIIIVKGQVPGPKKGHLKIRDALCVYGKHAGTYKKTK